MATGENKRDTLMKYASFTLLLVIAISSPHALVVAAGPEIVSVEKIWDRGQHNAFTDLIRFRDRWWCTFREGEGHAGDNGRVRVIVSVGRCGRPAALQRRSASTDWWPGHVGAARRFDR